MKRNFLYLIVVAALTLSTTACDKASKMAENLQNSVKDSLQEKSDEMYAKTSFPAAYDKMVSCANRLSGSVRISSGSIAAAFESYKEQNLAEVTPKKLKRLSARTIFDSDAIKDCEKDLTEANKFEFTGRYVPLGDASKALLKTLPAFGKAIEDMEEYLKSKAYIEDEFAKGKELNQKILELGPEFVQAYTNFDSTLNEVELIRNEAKVEGLKKSGKMRSAFGYEAYGYIQRYLTLLDTSDPTQDAELAAKLDELTTKTAAALESMKAELGKKEDDRSSKLKNSYDKLNEMLGDMREAKSKNFKGRSIKELVDDYNHFITFNINMNSLEE